MLTIKCWPCIPNPSDSSGCTSLRSGPRPIRQQPGRAKLANCQNGHKRMRFPAHTLALCPIRQHKHRFRSQRKLSNCKFNASEGLPHMDVSFINTDLFPVFFFQLFLSQITCSPQPSCTTLSYRPLLLTTWIFRYRPHHAQTHNHEQCTFSLLCLHSCR